MRGSEGATRPRAPHGASQALPGAADPSRNPRERARLEQPGSGPDSSSRPAEDGGARPRSASGNRSTVTAGPQRGAAGETRHRTRHHLPAVPRGGESPRARLRLLIAPYQCPSTRTDPQQRCPRRRRGKWRRHGVATPPARRPRPVRIDHAPTIERHNNRGPRPHAPPIAMPRPFPPGPAHRRHGGGSRPEGLGLGGIGTGAAPSPHSRKGVFCFYFVFCRPPGLAAPPALRCRCA